MRAIIAGSAVLAVVALGGCAVPSPAQKARLNGYIGHSEVDLLRGYGVPTRSYATQGHTFLAYDSSYTSYDPGFGGGFGPWGGFGPYGGFGGGGFGYGGFGGGYGGGFGGIGYGGGGIPPSVESYSCVTTFEVTGGRVAGWTLHGNGC